MSIRLESLRAMLRKERSGLMGEMETHMAAVTDIRKAVSAIDSILDGRGDKPSPRHTEGGETNNGRLVREKKLIRTTLLRELKANPDGLSTEELVKLIAAEPGIGDMSPFRVGQIARQMRDRGAGIIGDGDCWVYIPGAEEDGGDDDPENDNTGA